MSFLPQPDAISGQNSNSVSLFAAISIWQLVTVVALATIEDKLKVWL